MDQIKNSQFDIPFFVDSTEPPDHKCGGCEHRIKIGDKYTCLLVNKTIDLKRGTCLLWEEGPEKYKAKDIRESRVTPETAGYIEADKVNCGTCMHYSAGVCGLWNGKVKEGQCCDVWEQPKPSIGFDKPYAPE
jgi:hypothetical protein